MGMKPPPLVFFAMGVVAFNALIMNYPRLMLSQIVQFVERAVVRQVITVFFVESYIVMVHVKLAHAHHLAVYHIAKEDIVLPIALRVTLSVSVAIANQNALAKSAMTNVQSATNVMGIIWITALTKEIVTAIRVALRIWMIAWNVWGEIREMQSVIRVLK